MPAKSEAEVIQWAQDNPLYALLIEHGLTPREIEEVRFAEHYAHEFLHGTDGHSRLVVISKLVWVLHEVSETIGVHGHMLQCPDCKEQLTSLLLCTKCGKRFELVEQGTKAGLDWMAANMPSAFDDMVSHIKSIRD
jgi:hypothetical protein